MPVRNLCPGIGQVDALSRYVMAASKLHADDTPVPVLAPGQGKTKTGRLWTYVRDDRPAGDSAVHRPTNGRHLELGGVLRACKRYFQLASEHVGYGRLGVALPIEGCFGHVIAWCLCFLDCVCHEAAPRNSRQI